MFLRLSDNREINAHLFDEKSMKLMKSSSDMKADDKYALAEEFFIKNFMKPARVLITLPTF